MVELIGDAVRLQREAGPFGMARSVGTEMSSEIPYCRWCLHILHNIFTLGHFFTPL